MDEEHETTKNTRQGPTFDNSKSLDDMTRTSWNEFKNSLRINTQPTCCYEGKVVADLYYHLWKSTWICDASQWGTVALFGERENTDVKHDFFLMEHCSEFN